MLTRIAMKVAANIVLIGHLLPESGSSVAFFGLIALPLLVLHTA